MANTLGAIGGIATFHTYMEERTVTGKIICIYKGASQGDYAGIDLDVDGMVYHFGTGGHLGSTWTTESGTEQWYRVEAPSPVKPRKLTQAIVREFVRILGGSFKRDSYGDLIVRFGEDTYHTNDLQDALGTARCMKGGHEDIDRAEQYLTDMGVTR